MLNDIKAPPLDPEAPVAPVSAQRPAHLRGAAAVDERVDSPTHAPTHLKPNIDRTEPGLHRARYLGERGTTDAVYEMPLEDRGSNFSIGLTLSVGVLMLVMMMWFAWSMLA